MSRDPRSACIHTACDTENHIPHEPAETKHQFAYFQKIQVEVFEYIQYDSSCSEVAV